MITIPDSPWTVPFDGSFRLADAKTSISPAELSAANWKKKLGKCSKRLDELQQLLYANDKHSVLLVFQAMDAAGKDSTIRAVLREINPAGCQVASFKQPSKNELDHDFLWRTQLKQPERGRIGAYNRSYYEEVLVVRVHPEYLGGQRLPATPDPNKRSELDQLWQQRFESINAHEQHLARNGTLILKFWLNVSQQEQHRRFASRIDVAKKNWKFSAADLRESALWDEYMQAYEQALRHTSTPWAPWFAVPADNKPFMRYSVADIIVNTLSSLDLEYPSVSDSDLAEMRSLRNQLPE